MRRWKALHPIAVAAHIAVRLAKRRGDITMPERCATEGCIGIARHFQHSDYSLPLTVTPLCTGCHERRHHGRPPGPHGFVRCSGGKGEKETEGTGVFELNDTKCADGASYDIKMDKAFKVISITAD